MCKLTPLACLLAMAALVVCGACGAPEPPSPSSKAATVVPVSAVPTSVDTADQGKWRASRGGSPGGSGASEAAANVKAIPYLQGYRPAQDHRMVVEHDRGAALQGLNLYVSGHAAEAVLMDMKGRTLHRWRYPLRRLWPDLARDPGMAKLEYWRRAYLYPNGDLLGIYEGLGIVKLDSQSRVLWAHRGGFHHDLFVTEGGTIYALDREGKILSRINLKEGVLEDFVTVLDSSGRPLRKISILECFERSPFAGLLQGMPRSGDVFHTNTLEVLDGRFADRSPAFRKGNLLVSVLKLDILAIRDPDRGTAVWARKGVWRRQHQPTFLDNGHLLVFDNLGAARDRSRVLEVDPLTGKIVWQFGGDRDVDLFSKTLGSVQRLPNGNTLISESENGRAVEVTREGRTVWEFYNPHRAGDHGELVAVLFEMVRLPPDFPFRGKRNIR